MMLSFQDVSAGATEDLKMGVETDEYMAEGFCMSTVVIPITVKGACDARTWIGVY